METDIYRTFWRRLWAAIIDGIVLYPVGFAESYIYSTGNRYLSFASTLVVVSLCTLYFIVLHAKYGQTLGKKLMGIKVTDVNSMELIGPRRAVLRELPWLIASLVALIFLVVQLFFIDGEDIVVVFERYNNIASSISFMWLILELVTMLTNSKRRAIHDWMANSVVLKVK
ncbi:RDD family protein [uncultured Chitinophaga sp.]|jgi:RDD family.|uniref:RDD family protein n=1 Tax=uncultured Chitinophaga sp. TaxID=339340 RepID=UPI0026279EC7|nr:RDD family protein [uncultured Chitinophaga sp.]